MTNLLQGVIFGFAFIGIGHTLILILVNIQSKNEWKIDVKHELAITLALLVAVVSFVLFGEF